MTDAFAALVTRAHAWFEQAHANGWLTPLELERSLAIEHQTPADLFTHTQQRPLVVAFFGGTGVGKSSLLNRLAGKPIAQTGVERPTSRDVSIYLHQSVQLAKLPPQLPVEHVNIRRHQLDERRDVLWIDAPDIDSTTRENRKLVLAWLPHIDLLIYVVSPERYRDDVGWRLLKQRGERHGWMFVLNRWDEGDASQKDDFARMLRQAGFDHPVLLCTSCLDYEAAALSAAPTINALPTPDQFDQIEATIREHLDAHGARELERLGHRARLLELRSTLNTARQRFGNDDQWNRIDTQCQRHWQRTRHALAEGLEWPIRATAARFAVREGGLVGRVVRQAVTAAKTGTERTETRPANAAQNKPDFDTVELTQPLWDSWTQDKLAECLDAIEVDVRRLDIAAPPIRQQLDLLAEQAGPTVLASVQERLRTALSRPGTRLQRALRRLTGFLMTFLPIIALLWVAYKVVMSFHRGSTADDTYLGTNFAVSSALLVVVAWAVPFVFDRMLRPSLERTALQAMRRGLADGLDQFASRLRQTMAELARAAQTGRDGAERIVRDISKLALQPLKADKASLSRLLMTPARRLDGSENAPANDPGSCAG